MKSLQAARDDTPFMLHIAPSSQAPALTAAVNIDADIERVMLDGTACQLLGDSRSCRLDTIETSAAFVCDE